MTVLIIEDEQPAARRLRKMIQEIDSNARIVGMLDSIESVVDWWGQHQPPDLIFLDIQLADGSSFELFSLIDIQQPVIFVTAFDQYAIQAFKVNAIDYLLKPVKREELVSAIDKYRSKQPEKIDYHQFLQIIRPESATQRFLIRVGQKMQLVGLPEVAWFYTENKVTMMMTREGRRLPIDHTLEKLEELLDPAKFFRVNRQYLISIESIGEMYAYSRSRVKINLIPPASESIIVSTERSPHFKKWLTGESNDD